MAAAMPLNLTPHDIHIYAGDAVAFTIPASGTVARLAEAPASWGGSLMMGDTTVPVRSPYVYGGVEGMPATGTENGIVVSSLVAEFLAKDGATDFPVYSPDMGKEGAVRSDRGQIVGTKRLISYIGGAPGKK